MKHFIVEFKFKTRPWFRRGKWKTERIVFAANSVTEMYRLAREEAGSRYGSRTWVFCRYEEIAPLIPGPEAEG